MKLKHNAIDKTLSILEELPMELLALEGYVHFINESGEKGKMKLDHVLEGRMILHIKNHNTTVLFESPGSLVQEGWVLDEDTLQDLTETRIFLDACIPDGLQAIR